VPPTAGAANQAAQRILTLATESLDMMRGVTAVVKDSLDRADAWIERLRIVGLQRQAQDGDTAEREQAGQERQRLPPPPDFMQHRPISLSAAGSANTSVTSSPVLHTTMLPSLRSSALSPPVHNAGTPTGTSTSMSVSSSSSTSTDSYFSSMESVGSVTGFGKLSLGSVGVAGAMGMPTPMGGKKGLFTEEGEGAVGGMRMREECSTTPRPMNDGGTPKMDVDP